MGTYASVSIPSTEKYNLAKYYEIASDSMSKMETRFSIFRKSSEINRINFNAGKGPVPVSSETFDLLQLAHFYSEATEGCFDITVAPLMQLWGFINNNKTSYRPPTEQSIAEVIKNQIGYKNLFLSNNSAYLIKTNMMIDLGGIAKGFAVDVCFHKLQQQGASNIMINLGGNIRCAGIPSKNSSAWKIGIRDPFEKDKIIGTLLLTAGQAVATSGNYEKFRVIEGKRYSHIMNPISGYPVEGMASVTIIASSATEADALSTALFVAGITNGYKIIKKFKNCHAIMIPDKSPLTIYMDEGVNGIFTPIPRLVNSIKYLTK